MLEVPSLDDTRIMVSIQVPIKGRKQPLVIRVPRLDFIDEEQHEQMSADLALIDTDHADEPLRKRLRMVTLSMLKPFLNERDFQACQTLAVGQLNLIRDTWSEQSVTPLGELLASVGSSTEISEAPSSTTST